MTPPHRITSDIADSIRTWILERGGAQVWDSADLSNPGQEWMTPVRSADGATNTAKPHWSAGRVVRVLTQLDEVEVVGKRLVKRFHVGVRMGSQGLKVKVTAGGTRRIRAAVAKAGAGAWHEFDYATQDALIFAPTDPSPLMEVA